MVVFGGEELSTAQCFSWLSDSSLFKIQIHAVYLPRNKDGIRRSVRNRGKDREELGVPA
jgi:hypothetical protein